MHSHNSTCMYTCTQTYIHIHTFIHIHIHISTHTFTHILHMCIWSKSSAENLNRWIRCYHWENRTYANNRWVSMGRTVLDECRARGLALRGLLGPWNMNWQVPGTIRVTERRNGQLVKVTVSAPEGWDLATVLPPCHALRQSCHWGYQGFLELKMKKCLFTFALSVFKNFSI